VLSFREADCDTDYFLVFPKFREKLDVIKQPKQMFDVGKFSFK